MRLGKDLIGKPIITIDEGRHIGKVKDLYVDQNLTQMTGIHLGKEGLIRRKENLIPREKVVVFGVDAVLVVSHTSITDSNEVEIDSWIKLDGLIGREIDTPGGTKRAVLGDIILDITGRVIGFALSKVAVDGPIAETRAISREVVVDNGNEDGVMTIYLTRAEQLGLPDEKDTSLEEAEPVEPAEPTAE